MEEDAPSIGFGFHPWVYPRARVTGHCHDSNCSSSKTRRRKGVIRRRERRGKPERKRTKRTTKKTKKRRERRRVKTENDIKKKGEDGE